MGERRCAAMIPDEFSDEPPRVSDCPTSGRARPPARRPPRAVVFTGAGMSTESGLPDFRSNGGLWKQNRRFEELASREALETDYDEHVAFYRWRIEMLAGHAPNDGHRVVADWQRRGLVGDRRHAKCRWLSHARGRRGRAGAARHAGERALRSLRRASARPRRSSKRRASPAPAAASAARASCCSARRCRRTTLRAAWLASERAPLFIVLGSSLAVAPANLLPEAAVGHGAPLVIVNRDPTPLDRLATLVINAGIGETLRAADRAAARSSGRQDHDLAHERRRAQVAVNADLHGVDATARRAGRPRCRRRRAGEAASRAVRGPLPTGLDAGAVERGAETAASRRSASSHLPGVAAARRSRRPRGAVRS